MNGVGRDKGGEPSAVDRLQAVPLYHQIFLQLREEIISGSRAHGSRLPTEEELSEAFGVSRITARRSLAELAATNLVERKRRVGTRVIYQSPATPIQGSIEQAVDSLLTYGRKTKVRILELDTVAARVPVSDALQVAPDTPVLRVERVRWLDEQPISHLVSHVPGDLAGSMDRASLTSTPMLALLEQAGVQIGAAMQTITASLADPTLASLLQVDIGSPILRVSRTVLDATGRPVQHVLAQFRPDLYQIRLDLHSARA